MNPDHLAQQQQQQEATGFEAEDPNDSAGEGIGGGDSDGEEKPARRSGRRKIKIEYIEDKNRRHITFSKRKAGIMKKAYELSTLTGTQVLLLVVSETGLVYTFTTVKLQPIVTKPEGKNLIQACLNAPDPMSTEQSVGDASYNTSPQVSEKEEKKIEVVPVQPTPQPPPTSTAPYSGYQQGYSNNNNGGSGGYPGYNMTGAPTSGNQQQPYQQSPQQQSQQSAYGQMPQPAFYGNQQHYMPHQQGTNSGGGYWQGGGGAQRQPQQQPQSEDDKSRIKKVV